MEAEIKPLFLLDVDGVLLLPRGYRAAFKETFNYFTRQMGFGEIAPDEQVELLCESQGITNEWDMVAICLAALIDKTVDLAPGWVLPSGVLEACQSIAMANLSPPKDMDYERIISEVGANRKTGIAPAEIAYSLNQDESRPKLFPNLYGQDILASLLTCTRDVANCETTRIYQNFTLGVAGFRQMYALQETVVSKSLLQTEDIALISPETRSSLLNLWQKKEIGLVAFTARPSLPPRGVAPSRPGYAPEAEYGLTVVGLEELPLIAYGRLQYMAELFDLSIDTLVKPSPVQALAAIGAALGLSEREAVHSAVGIAQKAGFLEVNGAVELFPVSDIFRDQEPLDVHVFEDAPTGVRATKMAGKLLEQVGISSNIHCWGVSRSDVKREALNGGVDRIFPSINDAVPYVLAQYSFHST